MADRVVVFVDYQNVYRRARGTFHDHDTDPHFMGQVHPLKLAQHLAADSPYDRELLEVRVYRGMPSSSRDPKGYGACRRQIGIWSATHGVSVITRPLQYLTADDGATRPHEKGIDVALAVDVATMAADKAYDVAIVCSLDTDLHPAFEYVLDKQRAWGKPRIETAAWTRPGEFPNRRLSLRGAAMFCHWVDQAAYTAVQDLRDYTQA